MQTSQATVEFRQVPFVVRCPRKLRLCWVLIVGDASVDGRGGSLPESVREPLVRESLGVVSLAVVSWGFGGGWQSVGLGFVSCRFVARWCLAKRQISSCFWPRDVFTVL